MKSKLTCTLIALCAVMLGACNPGKQPIKRLIDEDHRIAQATKGALNNNSKPSDYTAALERYCSTMELYDIATCPADIQQAYREHIRAWRQMQRVFPELPDSEWGAVGMALRNLFGNGEIDGGATRIQGAYNGAQMQIQATWLEVVRLANEHGVSAKYTQ